LSPASKLVAVTAFVFIVVLTPREWIPAFAAYAVLLLTLLVGVGVGPARIVRSLTIEIPFVAFALLLPFVGPDPAGFAGLSVPGMWAAWNILVKASLGVLAATLLAATTLPVDMVAGLQTLRLQAPVVAIFTFFIRYVDVVSDQYRRMRVAQQARGFAASSPRSWPVLAGMLGALFVRSFERGERVHLALVSRGYDGRLPLSAAGLPRSWAIAAVLPAGAAAILLAGVLVAW
jgi:cobalt/nickel transport system permease protein